MYRSSRRSARARRNWASSPTPPIPACCAPYRSAPTGWCWFARAIIHSRRGAIRFADALAHQFVGLGKGSALQEYLAAQAARAGLRIKTRVRLQSFNAVCGMVERNVGIAVIPETAAMRCQKTMAIRRVRLSDPWATRQLMLCMRRYDALPPYARQLVAHLRA